MHKTTVYLSEEEIEGLRRLAVASGKSQAALIREAVRRFLRESEERKFHSMGKGVGTSEIRPRWSSDDLRSRKLRRK